MQAHVFKLPKPDLSKHDTQNNRDNILRLGIDVFTLISLRD